MQNGANCCETGQTRPRDSQLGHTTGQKWTGPVCFGCGKPGHIQANFPDNRARPCAAAVHADNNAGTMDSVASTNEPQGEDHPPEDKDIERDYLLLDEEEHPSNDARDDEDPPSLYNWDDADDDDESLFWASALSTPEMGYCVRRGHAVTCDKQTKTMGCGPNHHPLNPICLQAGVTTGNKLSLYDHRIRKHMGTRPMRPREQHQTLSRFWEINGT